MVGELTARDVRAHNRSRVLSLLLRSRSATRPKIARELDLSAATVAHVVADLVGEGLLVESGQTPSEGGRPSALLSVAPGGAFFIGVGLGETGVTVELFDLALNVLTHAFESTGDRDDDVAHVGAVMSAAIEQVRRSCPDPSRLFGVGVGVPGIVERGLRFVAGEPADVVIHAQSRNWPGVELRDLCGDLDLPVFVDNGAKTLAVGEAWLAGAPQTDDSVTILHGRGLGAGIITGGRLLQGSRGSAGEWGHTKLSTSGPRCACGRLGCLEAYVGGVAIADRWRQPRLGVARSAELVVADLMAQAAAGDAAAEAAVNDVLEILGLGIATLVNIFNPQRIVIGGWAGLALARTNLDALAAATRSASLDRPASQFEMTAAAGDRDGVALGAALLAVDRLTRRRTVGFNWSA